MSSQFPSALKESLRIEKRVGLFFNPQELSQRILRIEKRVGLFSILKNSFEESS
jgi:hypothetical protein